MGVVGLGVMGGNLARNIDRHGFPVVGYDLDAAKTASFLSGPAAGTSISGAKTPVELMQALERPRRVLMMVPAGAPVDSVIRHLQPHCEKGDILIDGGNSFFRDTDRRSDELAATGIHFVGIGVSGGEEGALHGPSIMPGGTTEAWQALAPILRAIAARAEDGEPCVAHMGPRGAGHYVKMVHNGIEYGDMQLIAETGTLLREGLGQKADAVADTFQKWNDGDLSSFLIEITADIFRTKDPQKNDGSLLVDAILDKAGQKGTGKWTVVAAAELGVAIPTITAAVDARVLSSAKETRVRAEKALGAERGKLTGVSVDDLGDALYASKIASYTQGFAMLKLASDQFGYGTNLGEIARIWTAGCIIRAKFLDRVRKAFAGSPAPELLALAPDFAQDLRRRAPGWRRVVSAAAAGGYAIPGLAASLSWFDTLSTARGSAGLIQAQRDYFGSHTYERTDNPGEAVHTEWPRFQK